MTDVLRSRFRPDVGGGRSEAGGRGGGGEQLSPGPSGLPVRRRWGRVAAGAGLVLVWVWGTVAAVRSAGDLSEVVVLARDVERYEQIERSDLRVVRAGIDPGLVETLPASRLEDVVGRVAAVDLVGGSLLAPGQLVGSDQRVVGSGEALVGARLKAGELPADGVMAGSAVVVVVRPSATTVAASGDADTGTVEVQGWLMSVNDADRATGERSLSLVVPRSQAAMVTAAAADGRVSLVVVEG
jgi:hypothetical protein